MSDWMSIAKAVSDLGLCIFLVVYMVVRQDRILSDLVVALAKLNQLMADKLK